MEEEKIKKIFQKIHEREVGRFSHPDFLKELNNGVMALARADKLENGPVYTFSECSKVAPFVTGNFETLDMLIDLFEERNNRKIRINHAGMYVPFSNMGQHYFREEIDDMYKVKQDFGITRWIDAMIEKYEKKGEIFIPKEEKDFLNDIKSFYDNEVTKYKTSVHQALIDFGEKLKG